MPHQFRLSNSQKLDYKSVWFGHKWIAGIYMNSIICLIEKLSYWNIETNRKFTKKLCVNKLSVSKHIASTLSISRWILTYSVAYFFIQVCVTFSCYMNCFMKRPGTNKRIIITAIFFTVFVLKHRHLPLLLSIIANGDISKYDI